MQALKRMEHALTMATEQLEHMQSIYNELQAKVICGLLLSMTKEETSAQSCLGLLMSGVTFFCIWKILLQFPGICFK